MATTFLVDTTLASRRNKRGLCGGLYPGLDNLGQAGISVKEERHSLEKDSLSKIGNLKKCCSKKKEKGGSSMERQ